VSSIKEKQTGCKCRRKKKIKSIDQRKNTPKSMSVLIHLSMQTLENGLNIRNKTGETSGRTSKSISRLSIKMINPTLTTSIEVFQISSGTWTISFLILIGI